MADTNGDYQFGGWLVEPQLNRVSREGEVHQIEPRTMDVLSHLLEHAGQVVTSNELLDRFWEGRSGEPGTISKRVGQIRQTLGSDTKQTTYIETIARRGYRTIAPVAEPADPGLPTNTPFTPSHELHELHEEDQAPGGTPGHPIEVNHTRSRIAYTGPAEGGTQIWIRERDQLRSKPIPGTEGAWHPLFAPEGGPPSASLPVMES